MALWNHGKVSGQPLALTQFCVGSPRVRGEHGWPPSGEAADVCWGAAVSGRRWGLPRDPVSVVWETLQTCLRAGGRAHPSVPVTETGSLIAWLRVT